MKSKIKQTLKVCIVFHWIHPVIFLAYSLCSTEKNMCFWVNSRFKLTLMLICLWQVNEPPWKPLWNSVSLSLDRLKIRIKLITKSLTWNTVISSKNSLPLAFHPNQNPRDSRNHPEGCVNKVDTRHTLRSTGLSGLWQNDTEPSHHHKMSSSACG